MRLLLSLHACVLLHLCSRSRSLRRSSSTALNRDGIFINHFDRCRHSMQTSSYSSDAGYEDDRTYRGGFVIRNMSVRQLHGILTGSSVSSYQVVDVREDHEVSMVSLPFQTIHYLPLSQSNTWIPKLLSGELLDKNVPTACLCHHGVRSKTMAEFLGDA